MAEVALALRDPFFWACLSAMGLVAGNGIVANVLPRSGPLGIAVISSVTLSRALLVLPFCAQPRFELAGLHAPLGLALMAIALIFTLPVFRIDFATGPDHQERLHTTGPFRWVRHPGYLGGLLLGLGWAVLFQSTLGVALTPLWWLGFLLQSKIEEASLERAYGADYLAYRERVPNGILPWPRPRRHSGVM